jgi:tetratricopeptide (TPR) repeat protein
VTAAEQIADRLSEQSIGPATVDSLRIAAGEAHRATGDAAATRDILAAVVERHAAHPVLARVLLGVLGPDDREIAGFLLAAVSGTALAPEAARALRRWSESDAGASRLERLRRAQALCPGDPLVRADLEAAQRQAAADPGDSAELAIGLVLAPRISGDPVVALETAREKLAAGDPEGALAELGRGELPRGELLVAGAIIDAAAVAGSEAVASSWQAIRGELSDTARALLTRRVIGEQEDADALAELASLATGDRVAARAALVEAQARGPAALEAILDDAAGWPGLDPAGLGLERLAVGLDGMLLTEQTATEALVEVDELDDPRTRWLAIAACGRTGDWQRAADLLASGDGAGAGDIADRYRAGYLLLERADDAAAAESRLTPLAEAHPSLAPITALLDAARRKLGVRAEMARPTAPAQRASDPWTAAIHRAEAAERAGDTGAAIEIYKKALAERPGDPIALEGLSWAALASVDAGVLAERALANLRAAEEIGDAGARADAYAALARIDAEVRGDPSSALIAWESCADLDPSRPEALRALEIAYLAGDRHRDLLKLYGRLLAFAESDREIRAFLRLRARSADLAGREMEAVIADYRQIAELDLDSVDRMALFFLEASLHGREPGPERAELERHVAGLLAADPRSAAAFLCRSGETWLRYGDHAKAVERFTGAIAAHRGHLPSIRGWRDAALLGDDWEAFAEATEAEGEAARDHATRVDRFHLAGVVWMDRVGDSGQARRALSAVLAHEPHHEDAFARLRLLYDEVGDDEGLGDLLRQLLESSPPRDVALAAHLELAGLCRNFWEDREGAVSHLRAVLELAPSNKKAIAELSDIFWELGRWDEAADALIRRAKVETDPSILKHLFYRLGTIYADHLPDSRWAVRCFRKVLSYDAADAPALDRLAMLSVDAGDHKTALAAYERLLKLELGAEENVRYLHRIAEIQETALGKPADAERALRIAFDLAPHSAAALKRLVDFYTRAGDMRSIRVNLDRAAQAMRARMAAEPLDPRPYVVIARVLQTRESAGVRGSLAVAQAAAEIARSLGDGSSESADIAGSRPPGRPRLEQLSAPEIDELLIPRVVPAGLRVVLDSLRSRLPKYIGADVKRFGVGRSDRLRKGKHPVANLAREMAGELGFGNVDVYVSSAVTDKAMVVPTSPPSVILGSRFSSIDRGAELAFALGRCLKLAQMGLAVVDTMSPDELDKLVAGMVRQFAPDFLAFNLDDATLSAEQHRLRRLIPGGLSDVLRPHALALTGVLLEPGMLHASLRLCGLRAGLVASGNAAAALAAALRHSGYSTSQEAVSDPDIAGMLRFAVSEEHVEIQSLLVAK